MPLLSSLGRQRQAHLCESKAGLVYMVISETARTTERDLVSKKQTEKIVLYLHVCVHITMHARVCTKTYMGGQRAACLAGDSSPFHMRVPGIELKSSGLAARAFTH